MLSFLDLPAELREATYVFELQTETRSARFESSSQRLIHPSSLRHVNRQVNDELSALLSKHAPIVVLPVLDLHLEAATTYIDQLPDHIARTLFFAPARRSLLSSLTNDTTRPDRELRLEMSFVPFDMAAPMERMDIALKH